MQWQSAPSTDLLGSDTAITLCTVCIRAWTPPLLLLQPRLLLLCTILYHEYHYYYATLTYADTTTTITTTYYLILYYYRYYYSCCRAMYLQRDCKIAIHVHETWGIISPGASRPPDNTNYKRHFHPHQDYHWIIGNCQADTHGISDVLRYTKNIKSKNIYQGRKYWMITAISTCMWL